MNKIEIGAVAKPQGIKGELKIRLFGDGFKTVADISAVEIRGVNFPVESFRAAVGDEAILKLKGIDDRNAAETLRRESVYADRSEISVPEGRFFIADVIGCKLFLDSGKEIGEITDIVSGNVDYYHINTSEGAAVFPLIDELNAVIDPPSGKVTVSAKKFTEVVLYED